MEEALNPWYAALRYARCVFSVFASLLLSLVLALLTGCIGYPVTEFRGTLVNIDGDGQVRTGIRELGSQRIGSRNGDRLFALGLSDKTEFQLLYPTSQSLRTVDRNSLTAVLVRAPATPARSEPPEIRIELEGPIKILRYRDNIHFQIRVDLKDREKNGVALNGIFRAFDQQSFEPMTYAAATMMLFGGGGAGEGTPAHVKPKEGELNLLRRSIVTLAKEPNAGPSFDATVDGVTHALTFTKRSVLKNPVTIELLIAIRSRETELKTKVESTCRELNLILTESPSFALNDPNTPREPHFLRFEATGQPVEVSQTLVIALQKIFPVTEESHLKIFGP